MAIAHKQYGVAKPRVVDVFQGFERVFCEEERLASGLVVVDRNLGLAPAGFDHRVDLYFHRAEVPVDRGGDAELDGAEVGRRDRGLGFEGSRRRGVRVLC